MLQEFKNGTHPIMLATDVAARGLGNLAPAPPAQLVRLWFGSTGQRALQRPAHSQQPCICSAVLFVLVQLAVC